MTENDCVAFILLRFLSHSRFARFLPPFTAWISLFNLSRKKRKSFVRIFFIVETTPISLAFAFISYLPSFVHALLCNSPLSVLGRLQSVPKCRRKNTFECARPTQTHSTNFHFRELFSVASCSINSWIVCERVCCLHNVDNVRSSTSFPRKLYKNQIHW